MKGEPVDVTLRGKKIGTAVPGEDNTLIVTIEDETVLKMLNPEPHFLSIAPDTEH